MKVSHKIIIYEFDSLITTFLLYFYSKQVFNIKYKYTS